MLLFLQELNPQKLPKNIYDEIVCLTSVYFRRNIPTNSYQEKMKNFNEDHANVKDNEPKKYSEMSVFARFEPSIVKRYYSKVNCLRLN